MEKNQGSRGKKKPQETNAIEKRREKNTETRTTHNTKNEEKTSKEATGKRQSVKTLNTNPGSIEERPGEEARPQGPSRKMTSPPKKEVKPLEQKKKTPFAKGPRRGDDEPRRKPR